MRSSCKPYSCSSNCSFHVGLVVVETTVERKLASFFQAVRSTAKGDGFASRRSGPTGRFRACTRTTERVPTGSGGTRMDTGWNWSPYLEFSSAMDTDLGMPVTWSWMTGLYCSGISRTFGQIMQSWMLS
eukprot:1056609-Pyramimonas_sp.AAC.1